MMNKCRFCRTSLKYTFADLGMSPLSNAFVNIKDSEKKENFYPLKVYVCEKCFLVQLPEYSSPEEIFSDYAYFSSYSDSWLEHAKNYTNMMIDRFDLNEKDLVIELGSNDGYMLQYFKEKDIPVLGVEPAKNVAKVAIKKGIPTLVKFFNSRIAKEMKKNGQVADLLMGINFLAQIPELNDFVAGMKMVLKSDGVITVEFPHLLNLMIFNQFDTIYHEHFSYFSLHTIEKIFKKHGLTIFDVDELPTHGGSLRIYAKHTENKTHAVSKNVSKLRTAEIKEGLDSLDTYKTFEEKVKSTKRNILKFLIKEKIKGKTLVGYGAPAKGNTLLNYCGIGTDFIDYTVDRNPHKQNAFLPGSRIPVFSPDKINKSKPDYVVIMPWNLKDEISMQLRTIKNWGGKFVVLIPNVEIF
jgi:SAM-dependent methyltransferase